ncbi:hypothetical protein JCM24511_00927 [Saitozyma sp. JCM 24511]|nr:hypothetical protein JCM24511_00927 [Saitozyma sp. JCM 24511]
MSTQLSEDQVTRLCQDLIYQVSYAFYDTPYILLLKLIVHLGVVRETKLAEMVGLTGPDVRKYLGMLHVHRLVKRHLNKEKQPIPEYLVRAGDTEKTRVRDVIYWYMDYREFANVVKYRIAMMRKSIQAKISAEVGQRGYICPLDGSTYAALDLASLFDPATNSFRCESCGTELLEADLGENDGQDSMQRFNLATQPIRDALKAVEGVTLPSVNILAWIAMNVRTEIKDVGGEDEEGKKAFTVVLGGEGEREIIERERLAEQQRVQNALPIWHTHSTVTGSATSLGLEDARKANKLAEEARRRATAGHTADEGDDALAAHYADLDAPPPVIKPEPGLDQMQVHELEDEDEPMVVKVEPGVEDVRQGVVADGNGGVENGHLEDEEEEGELETAGTTPAAEKTSGVMVMVAGIPKPLDDITEEDQELMTTDEYQAYYEAVLEA